MLLEAKNLSCGYKKKAIIQNVSFTLSRGEVLCLFGPNGVGKTTFFKTLMGFLKSMDGEILIKQQNMEQMNRATIAKNMAYVPQAHQMAFAFRVIDVVVLGRLAHMVNRKNPSELDYNKAWEALDRLAIRHLGERLYTQISGGERQMVLIARALAQDASILVMDEPTSNLDYGNQIKVMEQIHRLKEQKYAVIMTTHSPDQVLLCGDQVMIFHSGNLMKIGAPTDIMTPQLIKEIYDVDVTVNNQVREGFTNLCKPVLHANA
jgi:iron complex transport system ATP-binding protein